MSKVWTILLKLWLLAFASGIAYLADLPLHEWFHIVAGMKWTGDVLPYATYPHVFDGLANWGTAVPIGQPWWTYLCGGLLVAILWLGFGLGALWTHSKVDEYIVMPFLVVGAMSLGYSLAEMTIGFGFADQFSWSSIVGFCVFSIPVAIWRAPKLAIWLIKQEAGA